MQIFTLTNESDHGQQEKRENGVIFLSCDLLEVVESFPWLCHGFQVLLY